MEDSLRMKQTHPSSTELVSAIRAVNNAIVDEHKCYREMGKLLLKQYGWKIWTAGYDKLRDGEDRIYVKDGTKVPIKTNSEEYCSVRVFLDRHGVHAMVYDFLPKEENPLGYGRNDNHKVDETSEPFDIHENQKEKLIFAMYGVKDVEDVIKPALQCKEEKLCN
jgi:hypothetical protein